MLRTHTCGQLNEDSLNQTVVLCGWVDSRRDHGKIIFIDLRDRYGITQLVFIKSVCKDYFAEAEKLKNEDVIKVTGSVNTRPKGTINPKIPTGRVEVCVERLEILNKSEDIPFMIEESQELSEELRLSFRYLDLRRRKLLNNLEIRHKIIASIRGYLNREKFIEVETPFLTKSTPEGARDFLVPSRLNPGSFYALPQSPQLFKQILMVSGMDKYYQVARCFRDEDLRKDRQPEFTQIDLEMSFIEEPDVYTLVENMLSRAFEEVLDIKLKVPFKRITYKEAMEKYSTDKPDVGIEGHFRFAWITEFPLFKYDHDRQRWDSEHHPFTAPYEEDLKFLDSDPAKVRSRSYDLVLNGVELGSGSVRVHSVDLQKKIFGLLDMSDSEVEDKFGFLTQSLQYGAPPHGGFALGLDRFISIITGSESIRDVIAFPKTQRGVCPLSNAPSKISAAQLKELKIKAVKSDD